MKIGTAKRLEGIGEYYFSKKLREIESMKREGEDVINLGIGSPDLPPHPDVIKTLERELKNSNVHGYQSYKGAEPLRIAFAQWYEKWYGVHLDPKTEILPLIGSKEGIMHICMTYLNEGDLALIPNPGYPTYRSAIKLAGGTAIEYSLTEETDYSIDFDQLEQIVLDKRKNYHLGKIKLLWVNFPHMPTGRSSSKEFFLRLVSFARKHKILVCHDNPYGFILNDAPLSLLSVDHAKEVVIELNSLSKSHNMAGWRIGVLSAAQERIEEIMNFKSNMDSGMFLPIQLAAAKALSLDREWYESINEIYRLRQQKAFELLDALHCEYSKNQKGLFVWAKIPSSYKSGAELSDKVLLKSKVFITPGFIFGSNGDDFIRVSLCCATEIFDMAIEKIKRYFNA